MASCNLNDKVKFKLTPEGDAIVEKYLEKQRAAHGVDAGCCYRKDDHGYLHLQMWEFAWFFGKHLRLNYPCQIIVNNEIIFCGDGE